MGIFDSQILVTKDDIRGIIPKLDLILALIHRLSKQELTIMAAIDDLNAAVATLSTNFAAADTAIQAEIAALTTALATNNTAAIEAAATNISAISAKVASDTAALAASVAPPAAATP
jgi:hypothetical protein